MQSKSRKSDDGGTPPDNRSCERLDAVLRFFGWTGTHDFDRVALVAIVASAVSKSVMREAAGDAAVTLYPVAAGLLASNAVVQASLIARSDPSKSASDAIRLTLDQDERQVGTVMSVLSDRWKVNGPGDHLQTTVAMRDFLARPDEARMRRLVGVVKASGTLEPV